jgi:regulatory protein YycI of two-component signal transduction system YycFG
MNFKKIELIFFIAFILLDIFLFASYMQKDDLVESTVSSASSNDTTSILKSIKGDQITVGSLSDKKSSGYYLAAAADKDELKNDAQKLRDALWSYNSSSHRLTVIFEDRIKLANPKKPAQTIDKLIKNSTRVINGSQYVYDRSLSTKNTIVYIQQVHKVPIYSTNAQVCFNLKKNYVVGYTQRYVPETEILKSKKPIISQKRAVIWLYQYNKLVNNSEIKWVKLGYTKLLSANDSVIYIPTWVLAVESKSSGSVQYRRINAFTGAYMNTDAVLH